MKESYASKRINLLFTINKIEIMSATSISQSETVSLTFYNSVAGLYLKHILTVMSKTGSLPEPIPVNLIVLFWTVYLGTPQSLLDPVHSYGEIRSSLFCTFYFRTLLSNDFIVLCCKRYPLCQYEDILFFFCLITRGSIMK